MNKSEFYRILKTNPDARPPYYFMVENWPTERRFFLCRTLDDGMTAECRIDERLNPWLVIAQTDLPCVGFDLDENGEALDPNRFRNAGA